MTSDSGKTIVMGNTARCFQTSQSPDRQTMACMVKENPEPGNPMPSRKLEIYSRGGVKSTIAPGTLIREWHFWNDGRQVAVSFGELGAKGVYGLYDSVSARLLEKVGEPSDERLLPQWAKTQFQIEIESVPTSPQLNTERSMWIAKAIYQIGKLKPGMHRKDLFKILKEEGGLSFPSQRTYVYAECPYIKVDVRFKRASNNPITVEDPEDVIESISRPYLAWSTMD